MRFRPFDLYAPTEFNNEVGGLAPIWEHQKNQTPNDWDKYSTDYESYSIMRAECAILIVPETYGFGNTGVTNENLQLHQRSFDDTSVTVWKSFGYQDLTAANIFQDPKIVTSHIQAVSDGHYPRRIALSKTFVPKNWTNLKTQVVDNPELKSPTNDLTSYSGKEMYWEIGIQDLNYDATSGTLNCIVQTVTTFYVKFYNRRRNQFT
jgi:hypothetical protein